MNIGSLLSPNHEISENLEDHEQRGQSSSGNETETPTESDQDNEKPSRVKDEPDHVHGLMMPQNNAEETSYLESSRDLDASAMERKARRDLKNRKEMEEQEREKML